MYILFAFKSRAESMRLQQVLKRAGLCAAVINTPREASLGCGLSVKIYEPDYPAARELLINLELTTLLGVFSLCYQSGRLCIRRL